jgi:hypothetical protein
VHKAYITSDGTYLKSSFMRHWRSTSRAHDKRIEKQESEVVSMRAILERGL